MKPARFTLILLLTLFVLFDIEVLVLMLSTGTVVNKLALPVFDNLDFLWLLIKNNPWQGFVELLSQPVLIVGHQQEAGEYLAALYYYPVSSLLHLALGIIISMQLQKRAGAIKQPVYLAGIMLFLLSVNHVWLAGCCGAEPGWTLDTVFLSYVLSSSSGPLAGANIYDAIYAWSFTIRLGFLFVGLALLSYTWRAR